MSTCIVSQSAGLDMRIEVRIGHHFQAHSWTVLAIGQLPPLLRVHSFIHSNQNNDEYFRQQIKTKQTKQNKQNKTNKLFMKTVEYRSAQLPRGPIRNCLSCLHFLRISRAWPRWWLNMALYRWCSSNCRFLKASNIWIYPKLQFEREREKRKIEKS